MARANAPRAGRKANEARGEHEITLAGVRYLLRPAHEASVAIEDELGVSLTALYRRAALGDLTYRQMGVIVAEYVRAGAETEMHRAVGAERISELIYETGVAGVLATIMLVLGEAITGGRTATGEPKAAAGTGATATAG